MEISSLWKMILTIVLLLTQLFGGNAGAPVDPPAPTIDVQPSYTTGRGDVVDGDFLVHLPASWDGRVVWEFYETDTTYSVSFYERTSHEAGYGGHLFTLEALPEGFDYTSYPSYELVGVMTRSGYDTNLIALYPTDVQFTEEALAEYQALEDDIPGILDAITFADGVTFTPAD